MKCRIVLILAVFILSIHWTFSQSHMYPQYYLFNEIGMLLNSDYDSIVSANEKGDWLSEKELVQMRSLINYQYVPMVYLYEILVDLGRPFELGSEFQGDRFEIVFFTFYKYGSPTYPWALAVYKHKDFDIFYYVSFDILNHNDKGFGKIIYCRYYDEFLEDLDIDSSFDDEYENYITVLNFSGFAAWFESEKITRVKFLHDGRDFARITWLVEYELSGFFGR